jgi:hypothetical protein
MRVGVIADRLVLVDGDGLVEWAATANPDGDRLPNPATASYGYPSDDQTTDDTEGDQ